MEDALQHISTLLKEKAKPSPVVIQDFNDPSEKKTNIKQLVKCGSIVLYQNEKKSFYELEVVE